LDNLGEKALVRNEVEPFYFGRALQRLYGCHHFPQILSSREFVVIVCSPIGQEYLKSHRVIYQLAVLLSKVGFHVLRFDYFGCGDSEGNFEQGTMIQWERDVLTALDEIQYRSGIRKVCLIGLRIGARLALQATTGCRNCISLVFWEPVFNGDAYVRQLQNLHQEYISHLRYREISLTNPTEEGVNSEILGFPMTSVLRDELNMIKLDHGGIRPDLRLLALLNSEESISIADQSYFEKIYPHADLKMINEQNLLWREFNNRTLPVNSLKFIADWVGSVSI
jgi:alpha/beta superfamily hydrolase